MSAHHSDIQLAADIGGTFTDVVLETARRWQPTSTDRRGGRWPVTRGQWWMATGSSCPALLEYPGTATLPDCAEAQTEVAIDIVESALRQAPVSLPPPLLRRGCIFISTTDLRARSCSSASA